MGSAQGVGGGGMGSHCCTLSVVCFFFFKQKTAYEIS